jgi:hypothetical protein
MGLGFYDGAEEARPEGRPGRGYAICACALPREADLQMGDGLVTARE